MGKCVDMIVCLVVMGMFDVFVVKCMIVVCDVLGKVLICCIELLRCLIYKVLL